MSIKIKISEKEVLGIPNDVELGGYVRKNTYHSRIVNRMMNRNIVLCVEKLVGI
jgi:hypothetical protein